MDRRFTAHTFDDPQGTDLACLIRRLRERLQVPAQGLICVGTSATVGDEHSSAELREYAEDLFGQAFDEAAILREGRQSIDDVLGTAIIQTHISPGPPQPSLAERVDPARYANAQSYLKAQHELFFGTAIEGDFHAEGWRLALAKKLREQPARFVLLRRTLRRAGPQRGTTGRVSKRFRGVGTAAHRVLLGWLGGHGRCPGSRAGHHAHGSRNVAAAKQNGFPYPFFDFVQRHSDDSLERFLHAFKDLNESSRAYLAEFLQGDEGGQPPLVARVLNRLLEVNQERKSLRTEAQNLRRRSAALAKGPQDESTQREREDVNAEHRALDAIRRRINGRDVFQFLTDEGLIPNYAFPQEGVTWRPIIFGAAGDA